MIPWNDQFLALFTHCASRYQDGDHDFTTYYTPSDIEFLASIGCQTREFFDFIEDFCSEGNPSPSTALLIAAARRDYFHTVQKSNPSTRILTRNDIPTFGEVFEGMPYFPRIHAKAQAKLRGELDPDLMFACGGDRNFLNNHGQIAPADFLRKTWACGENTRKLAAWVKSQAPS